MKIRKYIYLFLILAVLFLTSSCTLFKKYEVKIYDGNGNIIEKLSVDKGYYVDLNNYDVPQKDSDEEYNYYFCGWDHEETFQVTESVDIYPEFEKYPVGMHFYTRYEYGFAGDEYTKEEYQYYTVIGYTGNAKKVEIPEKVGFPLNKNKKIKSYLPVKVIDEKAFSEENIEEVILPDTITIIGEFAFSNCTNLKKVKLSANLNTIYKCAFQNCDSLEEIAIPDSVTTIYDYVFAYCDLLKEVTFGQCELTTLYDNVFANCISLETVTLPDSLTHIPSNMFDNCENLTKINFNGEIKYVYADAFSGCEKLDISFIDFSKLDSIGSRAFYGCTTTPKKLDLSTIVTLGRDAFSKNPNIEEVILGKETTEINGFDNCTNLTYINFSELLDLETIIGLSDTNINKLDLSNNKKIEKVSISGSNLLDELILYKDVENRPFAKKIAILNGDILDNFPSCCEEVILPADLKTIPEGSFKGCLNLTTIIIPTSVETIEHNAFSNCTNLEQIIFEEGSQLKTIGEYAFSNCEKLYDIDISNCEKLELIDNGAFRNCISLINFKFETLKNLEIIGENAFIGTNIRIMKMPLNIKSLGNGLPSLLSFIYIPNTLQIDNLKFYELKNITAYESGYISAGNFSYTSVSADEIYYDDEGFVYLLDDDKTATIIRYCGLKRDIVTPSSINVNNVEYTVDEIGKYAFRGDFITSLKISDSIKSAYSYLFDGITHSKMREPYINLRILSIGANFEYHTFTKREEMTGIGVKTGYYEYWYSQINVLNSALNKYANFESERYNVNNLISAESLNPNSKALVGTKLHEYSITYETYPTYKEYYTDFTIDNLSSLNDKVYDIEYVVIDNFIFNKEKTVCLGYLGEYKTHLVLPTLEEGYECSFILNEYHCKTYEVPENVTLLYK